MTSEQLLSFKHAFDLFDDDDDGKIDSRELGDIIKALGQTPKLEDFLKSPKTPQITEFLNFSQFTTYMAFYIGSMKGRNSPKAMVLSPKTASEYVTLDELEELLDTMEEPLMPEEIMILMRKIKLNKDGKVSLQEVMDVIAKL